MNFSSLWCIKDRDPKQAERKVLSFQRHYSIPPPVSRPDLLFFRFCFLFFTSRRRRESIFFIFMHHFMYVYALSSLSVTACGRATSPAGGGKRTCVSPGTLGGEARQREKFASPQSFSLFTDVTWLPLRDCAAEARPADETAEAEQGQRSAFCKRATARAAKTGHRNHVMPLCGMTERGARLRGVQKEKRPLSRALGEVSPKFQDCIKFP